MTKRDTNITKGFAALLLLMHHLFLQMNNPALGQYPIQFDVLFFNAVILDNIAVLGKVCVSIFVFSNAYGTVKSYLSRNISPKDPAEIANYTVRRMISLILSFQVVFLLAIVFQYALSHQFPETSIKPVSGIYGAFSYKSLLYIAIDFMGMSHFFQTPTLNATWWYMPIAYFLIFVIPVLAGYYQKAGRLLIVPVFFLARFLPFSMSFDDYLPVAALGVILAYDGFFEKLADAFRTGTVAKKAVLLMISVLAAALTAILRCQVSAEPSLWGLVEGCFVTALCAVIVLAIRNIPVCSDVLVMIGTHSMNIFLTHSLLYYYWFPDHIMRLRFPSCMLLVLLGETLVLSVIIEFLKKKMQLSRLADHISSHLINRCLPK